MKGTQTVKYRLQPGLTPCILNASPVRVGDKEVASVGRGFGEEGHLVKEVLCCFWEVIPVDWT